MAYQYQPCSGSGNRGSYEWKSTGSSEYPQFEVTRRIVFYNGITADYMLTIQGQCSLGNDEKDRRVSITCKTGPSSYKKHFLGLSDNVTYFVEQVDSAPVSSYQYRVVFKPLALVPDIEVTK